VRELLKLGLTVVAADGGRMKSSNYGVFSRGPDGHTGGHGGQPHSNSDPDAAGQ
jgi:hypothetical protein